LPLLVAPHRLHYVIYSFSHSGGGHGLNSALRPDGCQPAPCFRHGEDDGKLSLSLLMPLDG
jgi:hypothetical protein